MAEELPPTMESFWQAAASGSLKMQQCPSCHYVRWPPAGVCPECLRQSSSWVEVEGRGTIWSFVVYHRAYSKKVAERVPYNVALVELRCGARLITQIVDCAPAEIRIGEEVEVDFRPVFDDSVVPVFRPVEPAGVAV